MRISQIDIERFGVWRNFSQKVWPNGLTVFYGSNGTGKSTLLRFIRGVLLGYRQDDHALSERWREKFSRSGALVVEHAGRTHRLERTAASESDPGKLLIDGLDAETANRSLYDELLAGLDSKLFQSVFAVGLPEMQQLGTLEDEDVARHIYAMTLGPRGRQLQEAEPKLRQRRRELFDRDRQQGRLVTLQQRRGELQQQLSKVGAQRTRHRELLSKRAGLEARQQELTAKQKQTQQNLRGAMHLQRVWTPWQQVRECQQELSVLPELKAIAPDTLTKLDALEKQIGVYTRRSDESRQILANWQSQLKEARRAADFARYAPSVLSLLDQREGQQGRQDRVQQLDRQLGERARELKEQLGGLGKTWNLGRLEKIVDDPAMRSDLVMGAQTFQDVRSRHSVKQKRYRRRAAANRDRELAIRTELMELGVQGEALDEPLTTARQRLNELVQLGRLQLQASEYRERIRGFELRLDRMRTRLQMPSWVFQILFLFGVAGIGLFLWGLLSAATTGLLVGLIYVLVGITAVGVVWGLKLQYERDTEEQVRIIRDQRRDNQTRLNDVRDSIRQLLAAHDLVPADEIESMVDAPVDGNLVAQAARRLAQLEKFHLQYQEVQSVRRQLAESRAKLRDGQREVAEARKTWCQLLRRVGLDETTHVNEAFATWQKVTHARELLTLNARDRAEQEALRGMLAGYQSHVENLGNRMDRGKLDFTQPWKLLGGWETELTDAIAKRKQKRLLDRRIDRRRQALARLEEKREQLRLERHALLSAAGVSNREGLIERMKLADQRREWEVLLKQAERELQQAQQSNADIHISEDDLRKFNRLQNEQQVQQYNRELSGLDQSLKALYEELGSVKQEQKTLEAETNSSLLRAELVRVEEDLRAAAEDWYATHLAEEAMDELRGRFERNNQPELLADATPLLQQLTLGRYTNIWTPLGKHALCVDDDRQHPWPVQLLSGGTREQLFLAVRMAMVRRFATQNVELPMVLDDVTVNFDDQRAEAAADSFIEFGKQGQQLLVFTSHLHFAQVFQQRGIEPVWLPMTANQEELLERRAG